MFGKRYPIRDKVIVVTGASSGIGREACVQLATEGAKVIALARREPELQALKTEIESDGGDIQVHAVDLTDYDALDAVAEQILEEHGKVDVLVNNAGRSIRRKLTDSLDRFHDFERCMKINYFAAVRLTLKLLPGMLEARDGHVVNVVTWGTLLPSPKFAAYIGSKSALDGFSKALGSELHHKGIASTNIHYPVVYTDMIKPAADAYENMPGMSARQAGAWIVKAVTKRPARIAPSFAVLGGAQSYVFPKLSQIIVSKITP